MAIALAFVLTITPLTVIVKDHGVHGHTFPIEEEDLLECLKRDSQDLTSQEVYEINQKLQSHYKKSVARPALIKNLKEATARTIHYFDPTIVVKQEIKDGQGNIVIAQGASYNPLQHFSLSEELLFFNGDDRSHLEWAQSLGEHKKWILIAGHPIELEEKENHPIYFDQNGLLTQKLKIVAIPARVSQEGNLLKIETVPMQRRTCES
jgi:conjugal transfer pilus assembly protein TraW